MEKSPAHFSNAAVADQGAPHDKQEPVVTSETDFSYFDDLQRQPMTPVDMAKFAFLVGLPTVFFIIAVGLMQYYNN